ncbi:hypothetical protein CJF30_00004926 [Rutstroemia sp. NJR-2017a BBW]|nr:hypothetical protein CJF30_00004926 [Rutstroemia sp. NJR-2017a BBW]
MLPLLLTWMLCIPIINASRHPVTKDELVDTSSTSTWINSTFPWPTTKCITPTITSQGMSVTHIIPLYEVCNLPGANTTSCSPSFTTSTATTCSTVLTGYFQRHTVSECDEIVTFSSQFDYALITKPIPTTTVPAARKREGSEPDMTTYVQNFTTYYAAPWQSIAANDPSAIHVRICGTDISGDMICTTITEVWIIRTEYVPVFYSKEISLSTIITSPQILVLGPSSSLTLNPGTYLLQTRLTSSYLTPMNQTSTSTLSSDSTLTTTITGPGSTFTQHLRLVSVDEL